MKPTPIANRRADLDWLRVIAFALLIFFHSAIIFVPGGIPKIENPETSEVLSWFVAFLQEFRLGLLFLISGVGVAFALKQRSRADFFRERSKRLLIPAIAGILLLVPPMVWLEKLHFGTFEGSYWRFLGSLFSDGFYPNGNFSWHHYWFVIYLLIYCLLFWPALNWLRTDTGQTWLAQQERKLRVGYGVFGFALILLAIELPLRPFFPGFRDLISDWASFAHWGALFLAGYALAHSEPLLDRITALRHHALIIGLTTTAILFTFFYAEGRISFHPFPDGERSLVSFVVFSVIRMLNAWCWLLACMGFAGRHLTRGSPVLAYLNNAVYPFYCVHLTIIVATSYFVVHSDWGVWPNYVVVSAVTVLGSILCFELIRRVRWLRPLFGLKPLQDSRH
ncbi:MAG: acyltransferase family protein [Pseudomonadaceae bacterium]|nr:acyltransferase family protein [Pseudomonadaceae bacterium]